MLLVVVMVKNVVIHQCHEDAVISALASVAIGGSPRHQWSPHDVPAVGPSERIFQLVARGLVFVRDVPAAVLSIAAGSAYDWDAVDTTALVRPVLP